MGNVLCASICLVLVMRAGGCGMTLHSVIAQRALSRADAAVDPRVARVLSRFPGAVRAGAPFPDYFFGCGWPHRDEWDNSDRVAEWAHWHEFHHAYVDYVREMHPRWADVDDSGEFVDAHGARLVAFLFGAVSHYIADVQWHGLMDRETGFLQQSGLADWYCSGNLCGNAHSAGDVGGEFVVLQEELVFQQTDTGQARRNASGAPRPAGDGTWGLGQSYSEEVTLATDYLSWWVPVDDLVRVFARAYIRVPRDAIEECAVLFSSAILGEKLIAAEHVHTVASANAFLYAEIEDFFVGGIDDNAAWTLRVWQEISGWLLDPSPQPSPQRAPHLSDRAYSAPARRAAHADLTWLRDLAAKVPVLQRPRSQVLAEDGAISIVGASAPASRSAVAEAGPKGTPQEEAAAGGAEDEEANEMPEVDETTSDAPSAPLAYRGSAVAMCDLDQDGLDDLVIASPGWMGLSGRVEVHLSSNGPAAAPVYLTGREPAAVAAAAAAEEEEEEDSWAVPRRFGASLACAGRELYVGAPAEDSSRRDAHVESQAYAGAVYAFRWGNTSSSSDRMPLSLLWKFDFGARLHPFSRSDYRLKPKA